MAKILVVDDEPGIREFLSDALQLDDHDVDAADNGEAAIASLQKQSYALVLTDLNMPGIGGMRLLRWIKANQPEVEVVVLTAYGTVDAAVEAMKLGAFEFLQKPIHGPEELQLLVQRALERRELQTRVTGNQKVLQVAAQLSYGASSMEPVTRALRKVAQTNATVLLLGESGSGKEIAAREIHQQSPRREKPFMAVNCAALTESLLESELFGHEKGAFTGADTRTRGRIEYAEGGTFFLDEIGELKLDLQAKLLRVLQEKRFERVGGTQSIDANVRWVAATNRDLKQMIAQGSFREDLYHRLAVFPIRLPPLRERMADLAPLTDLLLTHIASEMNRSPLRVSAAAREKLAAYPWPGNIRELKNTLERGAILTDGEVLDASDIWLEDSVQRGESNSAAPRSLAAIEREAIARALASVQGNRRKAAVILEIAERTLYDKIKRHGL